MIRLIAAIAVGALLLAVLVVFVGSQFTGDEVPLSGWIAFGAGTFLTVLVGSGLFALLFFSARQGYDDLDRPEDESSV